MVLDLNSFFFIKAQIDVYFFSRGELCLVVSQKYRFSEVR